MQPLRSKFTQSHKQLLVISPNYNCFSEMCSNANKFKANIRQSNAKKT